MMEPILTDEQVQDQINLHFKGWVIRLKRIVNETTGR